MSTTPTPTPTVYARLAEAQRRIGAVAKTATAPGLRYQYRSIDDLLAAAHPVLADLGLLLVPRVQSVETEPHTWGNGKLAHRVRVVVEYRIIAEDGTSLPPELSPVVVAEAIDDGDKAPGKALSYGLKSALGQLLTIPTEPDIEEQDWPAGDATPRIETTLLDPDRAADIAAAFTRLEDPDAAAKIEGWLASYRPDDPPRPDDPTSLATIPAEIGERLAATINRAHAATSTDAEPWPTP